MRDVAEVAGVSFKTVSRVINDEAGVADATAARVRDAIQSLGFRRNDTARSLRPGQASTMLGLIVADITNPFYSGIAHGAESVARKRGYTLTLANSDEDPDRERDLIEMLWMRRIDGLLLVSACDDHSYLEPELSAGTKIIFVDRPPSNIQADVVLLDNITGARQGVEYLLSQGHRHIGMVGDNPERFYTTRERLAGFEAAHQAAGLQVDPSLLRLNSHDAIQAETAADELLSLPDSPTAVFTTNNRNSLGVLRALHRHQARVAVAGFDDFELADLLAVPITVVAHDPAEMGRHAAEQLFRRIDGADTPPQRITLPTRLVIRGPQLTAG